MGPKIDAVGVIASDIKITVQFYSLLGFEFEEFDSHEDHIESKLKKGQVRLMIDSSKLFKDLTGEEPKPGNTSTFAVLYDSAKEVDEVVKRVKSGGFNIEEEPFDAPWGQRYAVVKDPNGFKVDLFANL